MEVVTLGINRQNSETQGGENLVRINKKSDFPLAVRLLRGGQVVPFPDCDFTMEAHIEGSSEIYRAERKDGVCKHCKQDGDRLILFFDNHNFVEGRLLMELTIEYPDPDYSEDGIRQEHFVEIAPIQIVADNGDALDLRLPEPRVVEKVVEKIVEKPVEKIVEKVVEKVIDNNTYTDLQKKAADWVSRLEQEIVDIPEEDKVEKRNALDMVFELIKYDGMDSVQLGDTSIFDGINSSSEDFKSRLDFAHFLMNGQGCYNTQRLYSNFIDPNFDLTIHLSAGCSVTLVQLFSDSNLNTITLDLEATDFLVSSKNSLEDKISEANNLAMFDLCTANKVIVKSKSDMNAGQGWYILPGINNSMVKCFDFSGGGEGKYEEYRIDNIIEKFLPDVTSDDHKPSLIFRDYTGEATEELKQKVLDKGYLSVEFYKGDTKVL